MFLGNPDYQLQVEALDYYVNDARNPESKDGVDYIVGMVPFNTLYDGVASLIGPENLCMELFDNPEEVHRVANAHFELFKKVYSIFEKQTLQYQHGSTNWQGVYSDVPCYQATKQLIDMGHQKIGFVFHGPSNAAPENPNDLRFFGYIRALQENGIPVDPSLYDFGNLGGGSGYSIGFNAMQKLYAAHRDVTAVFAFSDELAIGVAKGILSLGLKIPDDISVIGFDGTEIMEYFNPSLDTLYQPADQMALSAIESLFRMMHGGESSHLVYDAVLLKRGSCRARSHGI